MAHRVVFSPEAQDDLRALYDYIADRSGPDRAIGYIRRIKDYCLGFADFPERGTKRDDLLPDLRHGMHTSICCVCRCPSSLILRACEAGVSKDEAVPRSSHLEPSPFETRTCVGLARHKHLKMSKLGKPNFDALLTMRVLSYALQMCACL